MYGLRVSASCVLYVPEAQGSLPRGAQYGTYAVRVPASGVPYVPRTVWCTTGSPCCGTLTLSLSLTLTRTLTRLTLLRVGLASGRATLRREHGLVRVRVDWPRLAEAWGSQRHAWR